MGVLNGDSDLKALSLKNNSAVGYGNNLATTPKETGWARKLQRSLVPGIDYFNASFVLRDAFGQQIQGSHRVPVQYILESWSCSSNLSTACNVAESTSPLRFLSFDSESGLSSTLDTGQTVRCSQSDSTVTVLFSLYGSSFEDKDLTVSAVVTCLSCGKGQIRVNQSDGSGMRFWTCQRCLAGQYVIDPNAGVCHNCPLGAYEPRNAERSDVVIYGFHCLDAELTHTLVTFGMPVVIYVLIS